MSVSEELERIDDPGLMRGAQHSPSPDHASEISEDDSFRFPRIEAPLEETPIEVEGEATPHGKDWRRLTPAIDLPYRRTPARRRRSYGFPNYYPMRNRSRSGRSPQPGRPYREAPMYSQDPWADSPWASKMVIQVFLSGLLLIGVVVYKHNQPQGWDHVRAATGSMIHDNTVAKHLLGWWDAMRAHLSLPDLSSRNTGTFVSPISSPRIIADYADKTQQEMILGGTRGQQAHAAGPGVVTQVAHDSGQGNYIVVRHNATQESVYGHLEKILVAKGANVNASTVIATLPSTGDPVMYFGYRVNGIFANPHAIVAFPVS